MLKITGYSDKISTKPNEKISFYINCVESNYHAQLVKLRCGDMNPNGPGFKEEYIDHEVNGDYIGRKQEIECGSFGVVPINYDNFIKLQETKGTVTFTVFIFPTLIKNTDQYIIDFYDGLGFSIRAC